MKAALNVLGTPLVQDYIRDGEIHKLEEVMKESTNLGMKTFDQSLFELYQAGEISYEDALRYADSANEVRLRIKLAQGGDASTLAQGLDGVEAGGAARGEEAEDDADDAAGRDGDGDGGPCTEPGTTVPGLDPFVPGADDPLPTCADV